jgi:hypothetical protein
VQDIIAQQVHYLLLNALPDIISPMKGKVNAFYVHLDIIAQQPALESLLKQTAQQGAIAQQVQATSLNA